MQLPIVTDWRCLKTGDCCHDVVMTHAEWNAMAAVKTIPLPTKHPDPRFVQFEGVCPLLAEDKTCSVYAVRPMNCRRFLCFRAPGESYATACERIEPRLQQSRATLRQYAANQRKAQRYGLKHGWTQEMV